MIADALALANTLAKTLRALTESEHQFYEATLRLGATMLRTFEIEARTKEIIAERQYDELRDSEGNS